MIAPSGRPLGAATGQASDFLTLWDSYRTLIAKFISAKVHDSQETREDMVQEVFARAWSAMCKGYGASYDPQAWLYRIARNLVVDYYRQRSRRGRRLGVRVEEADPVLLSILDPSLPPADHYEQAQTIEQVRQLAGALTPAQKIVILRRIDGYAFAEIASEMDMGEGAVKALKYRATQQMLRYMEQL